MILSVGFLCLAMVSLNANSTLVNIVYTAEVNLSDAPTDLPIGTIITGSYLYETDEVLVQDLGGSTRHRFFPSDNTMAQININGIAFEDPFVDVNVWNNTFPGGRDEVSLGGVLSNINGTDWIWNLRLRDTFTGVLGQLVTDETLPSIDFYNAFPLGSNQNIPAQAIIFGSGAGFFIACIF